MSSWQSTPSSCSAALVISTVLVTLVTVIIARAALWSRPSKILPGPPHAGASPAELQQTPLYRPDEFPGARDVATPYGSVRAYEFGPEEGSKVLLVHGISTSCVTLAQLARALAARGCRVMVFDLFGRGFSDGVGDLPHDARLYTSQMLCVLASSTLPWTGSDAFRLIGYSLGGGLAVSFANAFPCMVSSLVLLAPAGLIRPESFGRLTPLLFTSGIIPDRLLAQIAGRRLQRSIAATRLSQNAAAAVAIASAEATALQPKRKSLPMEERVVEHVRWMVTHHRGFVPAFMSCIRYAPLTHQHDSWRKLSKRKPGATAVLLAESDEIIDAEDYTRVGLPLLGGRDRAT